MSGAAVSIAGLTKVYEGRPPVTAVAGVDLEIERGELFGLLGPNGAGKTTTIGVCTTRVRPTSGRVRVAGADVGADPTCVKRAIGVVGQENSLDRSCTVWENLYLHCRLFAARPRSARARAEELLETFHLAERASSRPETLSGGMARRLELARAVAHRPDVLFLDEPTAGLDPQSRLSLWELVRELRGLGATVVMSTHSMEEAEALCDRVAIIDHGRVLVCDEPDRLKRGLGAGTVIELSLAQPDQDLSKRLLRIPGVVAVERSGAGLRILGNGEADLTPRVVDACRSSGLRGLSLSVPTLETVFIELTGRALRD